MSAAATTRRHGAWTWWPALAAAVALLLAGCAPQPDGEVVRDALQAELDAALGPRVLQVQSLRRAGSAGATAATPGPPARLVYYGARLKLLRDYDFSRWESHSVGSLTALLGAGPRGVEGIRPDGNRSGDELTVYGALAFEQSGDRWTLSAATPRGQGAGDDGAAAAGAGVQVAGAPRQRAREEDPPSATDAALQRLRDLASTPAAPTLSAAERDRIVVEELERAHLAARQRLHRAEREVALAGGPPGGAYAAVAQALAARADAAGVPLLALTSSSGSVGNLRLLAGGQAQFALAQNDVAELAHAGRGRFAGAAQTDLRAVASLFPEPVHLVAAAGAGIASVADLRGKRVGLGPLDSGTRVNALAVLVAAGVDPDALGTASDAALPEAADALAAGRLDALFATIHHPAAALTRLAGRTRLAWIAIEPSATTRGVGLVPFELPARTYPGQTKPVPTLAATALLVTRADMPPAQVQAMATLLFDTPDANRAQNAALAQIGLRTAREGVTIPWHPQALAFLDANAPQPPAK
jgi:TRAP transporter TAXI family solute receptor